MIGRGAINDIAFSPCSKYLAVVSQDGCLRVINYDTMELVGLATSFFGGLLCVCWSPDGQLVAVGGEDDLVTVWSFQQKRIVARGQGHKSWVTVVAFDPFTTTYSHKESNGSTSNLTNGLDSSSELNESATKSTTSDTVTCYRLGSVAMDTQLCLWELTDDVLKQSLGCRNRSSMVSGPGSPPSSLKLIGQTADRSPHLTVPAGSTNTTISATPLSSSPANASTPIHGSFTQRLASLTFSERKSASGESSERSHRKNFSLGARSLSEKLNHSSALSASKAANASPASSTASSTGACSSAVNGHADPLRLIGTPACPRLDEVPMLEPLVCKKIAQERLTALMFREDGLITACQDGIVYTWARPTGGSSQTANATTNEGTMV